MVDEATVELGIPGLGPATRIGSGGFADVYRATQTNLRRDVAVKVLRAAAHDQGRMRFERECHAVGAVSGHPNIVGVHEGGFTSDGRAYLVMEFCPGGSLRDVLDREGPMATGTVIEIGQKIGRALGVAHDAGVLHRDVKPANILITAYGEPALADFGIARVEGGQQTATGLVTASFAHAAPEVLGGSGPTAASDIYSLGSTLFELATGRAPHHRDDDESVWAIMNRVINAPVPDPASCGIAEPLATTIRTATAKAAEDRFGSAGAFVAALSTGPDATAEAASAPPTVPTPPLDVSPGHKGSGQPVPADRAPTAALPSQHEQPTTAMPHVDPRAVPVASDSATRDWSPPTVHDGTTPPANVGRTAPSGPGVPADRPAGAGRASGRRRTWKPVALLGALAVLVGGGAVAVLLTGGDPPPAELAFAFAAGTDGPLDADERFDLEVEGAGPDTRFRYVVDGEPIGTAAAELGPFVAGPGRHSIAVEVTQGDTVELTEPVEVYVIGELPTAGYRANLSSITAIPENWPTALEVYDRLVDDGHTDLELLPSDRFPALQGGFWNLFVPGFGDDREAGVAYCESFGLGTTDECFVSFFDPDA